MNDRTSQASSRQLHEEVQRWIWSQGKVKLALAERSRSQQQAKSDEFSIRDNL